MLLTVKCNNAIIDDKYFNGCDGEKYDAVNHSGRGCRRLKAALWEKYQKFAPELFG